MRADTPQSFDYTDGEEVERRLLRTVEQACDVRYGSAELASHITDWPSRYHLSPARANLLRPIAHLLAGDTLEIGAGCGALTRYLGELGGEVVAVEGSPRRAQIAAVRCRDLSNVAVVCDGFEDLDLDYRFDAVLVVGVLEYCRLLSRGGTPSAFLTQCRRFLKPGGHLILAIENQLGLKYFCGAPEDHLGVSYYGIEDRYSENTPVTWGRQEILNLLRTAGWKHVRELFPFPDYKLPELVLTESSMRNPELLAELLYQYGPAFETDREYSRPFCEAAAWRALVRNGLVEQMANSFLLVASERAQSELDGSFIYSTDRQRAFQKQTWTWDREGQPFISRAAMYSDASPVSAEFAWRLTNSEFKPGTLYSSILHEILLQPGWSTEEIVNWAKPYYEFLVSHMLPATPDSSDTPLLPGEFLDCGPRNLLFTPDGGFEPFDLEWISLEPLPLEFVLFRSLLASFTRNWAVAPTSADDRVLQLVSDVGAALGVALGSDEMAVHLRREARFQSFVSGFPVNLSHEELQITRLKRRLPGSQEFAEISARMQQCQQLWSEERAVAAGLKLELERAQQVIAEQQDAGQNLEQRLSREHELRLELERAQQTAAEQQDARRELEARLFNEREIRVGLERSISWRLTEPLRKAMTFLRTLKS